ncbi:hypothetical protein BBW68_04380 [Candidatus Erwinia dacicola]|uniref:Uncharacterized protein n=2 Tax=Candidatus Erwinia dacicola TaxID=252393 RepID=A0A1E7Z4I5_9GAMM|nr:hypothetical protein BBW68_04380 [Candidatus Erwinia dacicola]RAP70737.1 hypothetical protein ACZ87_02458 [Candidatus Erwinia dacicola]
MSINDLEQLHELIIAEKFNEAAYQIQVGSGALGQDGPDTQSNVPPINAIAAGRFTTVDWPLYFYTLFIT